ncbi:MAG TPA: DNA-formamidopyrimidine glycosylase family protein [Myxococcales bacterium]|nr:DNA-formamidopyrimidine glycosylase family protein [Myxococcales bacterium]
MPELPDVTIYVEQLARRAAGHVLLGLRIASPFLVRSFDPPLSSVAGRRVLGVRRMGKRIVLELEGGLFLAIHLMISGRLHWKDEREARIPGKVGLAAFDFDVGTLVLTEASRKRRAALHLLGGEAALRELDAGGREPLAASAAEFREALRRENHTLKRALTDPRLFSGIGNAYSDEILWAARLSPVQLTGNLDDGEIERLRQATREVLTDWTDRLRAEAGDAFPEKVTAFREGMAVHGRYKQPCPRCGSPVQRIVRAENEVDYCATCQTGGRLLADRALSKLLGKDWPKTLEEMEEWKRASREGHV